MTMEYYLAHQIDMNLKKLILLVSLLLISGTSISQETWSLDDCIAYALDHNLTLNDFKYNTLSSKESYRQSIRNMLPTIRGFSDYNIRYGRSIDPNNNNIINTDFFSNNYSLNSSIDLFQGFQKLNSIKATKFLYKATKQEMLQQKYLLAFRIMSAFYDIRFYEELLEVSMEQQEVSQANYNLVQRQIQLGMKAGADLYEAESLLLTDKLNVTRTGNLLTAAKLKLIQEMNLEKVRDISVQSKIVTKIEGNHLLEVDSDSIYNKAKFFIPLIKAQELRTKAAKKEMAVARGDLYPALSFFAGYGTGYFETNVDTLGTIIPFRTQIKDNSSRYIGMSLSVPIFSRWSARSKVKQQKIELMRAKNNLDVQKQELYQLIQELVQDYSALQVEYEQSTQKMESQNLTFTIAQKKYEKGLINTLELFQAKNLFASAQNENLQVRFRLKVNESTIKFYSGLPVFNID